MQSLLNKFFDILLAPMQSIYPFWSLFAVSFPAGVLLLLIFRYTSNQNALRETKDRIKAHMLEIRLFKDNLGIMFSALKSILFYNIKYLKHAVKPMLFMIVPVLIILIQLDAWYGYLPLKPGESAVLSVKATDEGVNSLSGITLKAGDGITIETPPLRIPESGEVNWRIRADSPGKHTVKVNFIGKHFEKSVVVSGKVIRVSKSRTASGFWKTLLNPGEPPIPQNPAVEQITVHYPSRAIHILGWEMHWVVVFFILTLISGFAFKNVFRVEF